jgi:hypothetical protein
MQKVDFFKEKGLLAAAGPNLRRLNDYVKEHNQNGWKLVSIAPVTSLFGRVHYYILLLESID